MQVEEETAAIHPQLIVEKVSGPGVAETSNFPFSKRNLTFLSCDKSQSAINSKLKGFRANTTLLWAASL